MCSGSKSNLCSFDLEMEAGSRKGVSDKNCSKLLELAAIDDLPGFIHEVQEMGCDVNESSFWYGRIFGSKKMGFEERTPIMIASLYGSTEVLKHIIETCAVDVNKACGSDGATALHCASAGGSWLSVEVVKLLIGASGNINAVDANGKKPSDLIAPCVKSSASSKRRTLEMLLSGAHMEDVDEDDDEGADTPPVEKREFPVDVTLPDINNGIYGSDEFRMYDFKVKPCSRAYSHDWTECPFVHPGENARRRDPRKYSYTCVPCPEFKKGSCAKGDACEYAHGVFESWLHPAQYRTRLCKDETGCSRKVCFFAHKPEDLRPLYASTGSAMPSPKSVGVGSMDLTMLSPLSLGPSSTPPISPSVSCSSPMNGGMWQNKMSVTPPALQLPRSRLKTTLTARDAGLDEMGSSLSPYCILRDLKPTNLDDFFGSLDPSVLPHLQGSQLQSPTGLQIGPNVSHLRASYPSNTSRKPSAYGFDSSAAVAAAVMNSRSSTFTKRSQSFVDRAGSGYRPGHSGSPNSPSLFPSKLSDWSSPDGKLDWGFNSEEAHKLRKSASFGIQSGGAATTRAAMAPCLDEPDISWVNTVVKGVPSQQMPHWIDQMYIEQEQVAA